MSKLIGLEAEVERLDALAPAGYFLGLHIRFMSPLITLRTYSQEWQDHYTDNVYGVRDPLIAWAYSRKGACRWSEVRVPDPFGIFKEAANFGLRFGVAVSCGPFSSRSIGGIARSDREFTDDELTEIKEVVEFIHVKTEPPERLTKAQREALICIAGGARHAEAAQKLGISESALKLRLTSARNRLLARTTTEAIQRARDHNLL